MPSPATRQPSGETVAPEADPIAIRACLSPRLVAEFDAEWDIMSTGENPTAGSFQDIQALIRERLGR